MESIENKKNHPHEKNWKKTPHPITSQFLTSIYKYIGANMMHYNKNYSQIKILKILCIRAKISKTSILDHIEKGGTKLGQSWAKLSLA